MSDVRGYQFGEFVPISQTTLPGGITRRELLGMRETGMSNNAIASALNIAPWKVAKLIGATPVEIRKAIMRKSVAFAREAKHKAEPKEQPKQECKKSGLVRVCEVFTLKGKIASYTVDTTKKTVEISSQGGDNAAMVVPFKDCETFALELMDVLGEIK